MGQIANTLGCRRVAAGPLVREAMRQCGGTKPTMHIRSRILTTLLLFPFTPLVAQQTVDSTLLHGKGNLRFVHDVLLANLVFGRYAITQDGFTFYPLHPTWFMDSLRIPAVAIDSVTSGLFALHIHFKDKEPGRLRLKCQHPGKVAAEWRLLMGQGDALPADSVPDQNDLGAGYVANVCGTTFGSTLYTPICFNARLIFDANGLTMRPVDTPLSFIHVHYARDQIKRVQMRSNRIAVILHEGGRFAIRKSDNDQLKKAMSDWSSSSGPNMR